MSKVGGADKRINFPKGAGRFKQRPSVPHIGSNDQRSPILSIPIESRYHSFHSPLALTKEISLVANPSDLIVDGDLKGVTRKSSGKTRAKNIRFDYSPSIESKFPFLAMKRQILQRFPKRPSSIRKFFINELPKINFRFNEDCEYFKARQKISVDNLFLEASEILPGLFVLDTDECIVPKNKKAFYIFRSNFSHHARRDNMNKFVAGGLGENGSVNIAYDLRTMADAIWLNGKVPKLLESGEGLGFGLVRNLDEYIAAALVFNPSEPKDIYEILARKVPHWTGMGNRDLRRLRTLVGFSSVGQLAALVWANAKK